MSFLNALKWQALALQAQQECKNADLEDTAAIALRLMNASGLGTVSTSWPPTRLKQDVLDEFAKLIVSQPRRFV